MRAAGQLPTGNQTSAATGRIDQRIRALQQEAERLAGAARTLLNELRALEVERDLRRNEALQAEAAAAAARAALASTSARLDMLEQERIDQLPVLRAQLVDLYKRGRAGYTTMLFMSDSLREFGRASRMGAAMAALSRQRLERHRQTVESVRHERADLTERTRTLEAREADAMTARASAERAVAGRAARLAEIDSRRDLAAQYVGELQVARKALLARLEERDPAPAPATVIVPLAPFRGSLEWPVDGRTYGQFGDTSNRLGGSAVRNGVEITAEEGQPVRAVHGGTVVHADSFAGLGNLVILDHTGDDYSLYGYLGAIGVTVGQTVEGGAEVGQVGASPAGPAALYFEMRIDGRSVDPVQWLKPR